jgi:L-ribulose-5-phosphate 3-epimerase
MLLGYNTNGLAHHDPFQAVELLAELGYQSVALTIDHICLSPYSPRHHEELARMQTLLKRLGLRSVVETGARFLLDRYVKHEPTLMSGDRQCRAKRVEFYCRCVDLAADLNSDCVSLWSGILRETLTEEAAYERLVAGLQPVLEYAARRNVVLGFEPEPGMFIDTMERYDRLSDRLRAPHFRLTLDIGHLQCLGETPLAEKIATYGGRLINVHIEDMCFGAHEHLPFGQGEINFPEVIEALKRLNYRGGVHVELSRQSHEGPRFAAESIAFLRDAGA